MTKYKLEQILNFNFSETDIEILKEYEGKNFWVLDEYGDYKLYGIRERKVEAFQELPRLVLKNEEKADYIENLLKNLGVGFTKEIWNEYYKFYLFNIDTYNIQDVTAPLYSTDEYSGKYEYLNDTHTGSFQDKETTIKALEEYEKLKRKINTEILFYDFKKLTMDDGISAFFCNYPSNIHALPQKRFLVINLGRVYIESIETDPNYKEINDYMNSYYDPRIGSSYVVFDKLAIANKLKTINPYNLEAKLPPEVASLVIGLKGANMPKLLYNLGIPRISFNQGLETQRSTKS